LNVLKPVLWEVLDRHPITNLTVPAYLQLLLTAKQFKMITDDSTNEKTKTDMKIHNKIHKLKAPSDFFMWIKQRDTAVTENFKFTSAETVSGTILQSDFDSVRDLLAAEIDLTSAADGRDADTSDENSQTEQLFMIDKRPVNLQQDIYRTTETTSDDGDDNSMHESDNDDADDLLQATNYLDLDPEVEDDVECLDDDDPPASINTLPSDLNSSDNTTDGSQTTTESVISQSTVESKTETESAVESTVETTTESTVESTAQSTADSTSEVTSVAEEDTGSVVESLVSMVTTEESAESLQQLEESTTMEPTSSSDDFKDSVVESSARKRKSTRKTNPEVEPKRVYATRSRRSLMPR